MRLLRRNIGWTYLAWGAALLSGLVLTPVVVRQLGIDEYGVWAFVGSLAAYVALLDLGLSPAFVRFAAEARGRRSSEEIRALASVGLALYAAIGVVATVLGVVLAWLAPVLMDVPDDLVTPARVAAALLVLGMSIRFPLGLYANLLIGQQRNDVVLAAGFVSVVVYTALVLVLLPRGGGVVLLAAISLAAALLRLVLPLFWVRRELGPLRPSRRYLTRERLRTLLKVSGDNILIHIAARVVFTSDVIVVGVVLGPEAAAYYAVGAKLFSIAFGVGTAGPNLLFPAFAELHGAAEEERQRVLLRDGLKVGMAGMLIFALPLVLYPDLLIRAWIGGGLGETTPVLGILGAALLLQLPIHVTTQYLMARGLQHAVALVSFAAAVANVALSVVLAATVGIWGVALSTLVTNAAVLLLIPRLAARVSGLGARVLASAGLRPVLPALVVGALVFGAGRLADADELASAAVVGLVWVAAGGLAIWRFGLDERMRHGLLGRLRRREEPEPPPVFSGADY
jgi:O-antigen/teichoic acid export membrane protein